MDLRFVLNRVAVGLFLSIVLFAVIFILDFKALGDALLFGAIPGYEASDSDYAVRRLFKFFDGHEDDSSLEDAAAVFAADESQLSQPELVYAGENEESAEPTHQPASPTASQNERIESGQLRSDEVVGIYDIIYQPEKSETEVEIEHTPPAFVTQDDIEKLRTPEFLRNHLYTINKKTAYNTEDFNLDAFLSTDLTLSDCATKPKVLIFHTHVYENYADSESGNLQDGVVGIGDHLAELLSTEYNIPVMHVTDRFDIVDGKVNTTGAYERMEPVIQKILEANPSIEVVIDLHRDGVKEDVRLVADVDGKPAAKVMFVNGLSKTVENGVLYPISSLPNPNLSSNMALSFHMQLGMNKEYPGLMRKIYVNAYRYSLHMKAKSLLIEVGAQTNTMEEAHNSVAPIAKVLSEILLGK